MSDKRIDTPESHNPMTLSDALAWLRWNGPSVGRLCALGEKEALRLRFAYEACYRDQHNTEKQAELLKIVKDYIRRQLTITERADLDRRYGIFGEQKKL